MGVNDTHMTIFMKRRMFSVLLNAKTNVIQGLGWFLHTNKETVCARWSFVQVAKK